MPQDAFTISYYSLELNEKLKGAKINKITEPSADEIFLTTYTGSKTLKVIISSSASYCRVSLTDIDKQSPLTAPSFCMLLRKHLLNATIKSVEALDEERIIKIIFDAKNDFLEEVEKTLYVEIMGKYSNVILTENETILGVMKPTNLELNSVRALLVGAKYKLPPKQDKISALSKEGKELLLSFKGGNLAEFIFKNYLGISTQTADEIVYSYYKTLDVFDFDGEKFYEHFYKFLTCTEPRPTVITTNKTEDFYITDYTHLEGERKYFKDITSAMIYRYDKAEKETEFARRKKAILDKIKVFEKRELKKADLLSTRMQSNEDYEKNRLYGELITANIYKIKQGDESVTVQNYYDENAEEITIKLDKNLSPSKNAQRYYKKYAKQKRAMEIDEEQLAITKSELDYVASVYSMLNKITDLKDFDDIEAELITEGLIKVTNRRTDKKQKPSSPRIYQIDGFKVLCGKNNIQNDIITHDAEKYDLWLHTKNYHSSHVIIEGDGSEKFPDKVIERAAEITAYYSDASGGSVSVDYTLKKFVKKIPGARSGRVIYTDYKTCLVMPNPHDELLIY